MKLDSTYHPCWTELKKSVELIFQDSRIVKDNILTALHDKRKYTFATKKKKTKKIASCNIFFFTQRPAHILYHSQYYCSGGYTNVTMVAPDNNT